MTLFKDICNTRLTEETDLGDGQSFNIKTLTLTEKNKDGEIVSYPILTFHSDDDVRALDQLILLGHWLYSENEEFRDAYKKAFGSEMLITRTDLCRFLIQDYYHLFLYGQVVAKYVQSMNDVPLYFIKRCESNVVNHSMAEYLRLHKITGNTFRYVKGFPYYCYTREHSKVIKRNVKGMSDIVICDIKSIVPAMKQYATELQHLSEMVLRKEFQPGNKDFCQTSYCFRQEAWGVWLSGLSH